MRRMLLMVAILFGVTLRVPAPREAGACSILTMTVYPTETFADTETVNPDAPRPALQSLELLQESRFDEGGGCSGTVTSCDGVVVPERVRMRVADVPAGVVLIAPTTSGAVRAFEGVTASETGFELLMLSRELPDAFTLTFIDENGRRSPDLTVDLCAIRRC